MSAVPRALAAPARSRLGPIAVGAAGLVVASRDPGLATLLLPLVVVGAILRTLVRGDAVTLLSGAGVVLLLVPSTLAVSGLGGTATPAALIGLAAAWLWVHDRVVPLGGIERGSQPMRVLFLLFVAIGVASWVVAHGRPLFPDEAGNADRGLVILFAAAGLGLLAADGIPSRARLEVLLDRLVLLTSIVAVVGLVQFLAGLDVAREIRLPGLTAVSSLDFIGERQGFRRVQGTARHAIEFGAILTTMLPIALHRALVSKRTVGAWVAVALIAGAVPASLSRSAVVACGVGVFVLAIGWGFRERVVVLAAGGGALVAFNNVLPGLTSAFHGLFADAGTDPSVASRADALRRSMDFFEESPLLGRGFHTLIPDRYYFVDNQYLMSLVETGLLGLATVVALFLVGLLLLWLVRIGSRDREVRALALALVASTASAAVTFGAFDALSFTMFAYLVFVLLGCSGALWRIERGHARAP